MKTISDSRSLAAYLTLAIGSLVACGGSQNPSPSTPATSSEPTAAVASDAGAALSTPPADSPSPAAASAAAPASSPARPAADAPAGVDRSMNDIRAVVAGNRDTFRACYDRAFKAHPGIKGTFVLKFVVNPDGSVKTAEADQAKSEIHAADLSTCAITALKGLKFPQSKKGMESTVSYPFDFNPRASQMGDAGAP